MTDRVAIAPITRMGRGQPQPDQDLVAVEAPLGVLLGHPGRPGVRSLGVLMRTPGDDDDLVRGLLHTEGIIRVASDIVSMSQRADVVDVTLAPHIDIVSLAADRATTPTSACGLCGRLVVQGLDALAGRALPGAQPTVTAATISTLPAALRECQAVFAETGGLHAAGLFDTAGSLLALREDIGRHNAVDKLVGAALKAGWLPAHDLVLAVSGRVAFEIVQKAVMAGVPIIVAVGAPSDLAVDAARATRLTLIGFARDGRFNVYTGVDRVVA